MRTLTAEASTSTAHCLGNDRLLFGMILGVLAFWLFAQTILNISPTMAADLSIQMSVMNIAVSITALFSGIFIVVIGGLADRVGRVRHWQGAGRQRAVSLWSMGSWGGSGFAALFGGLIAQNIGWRWIFFASVAVSVIGMIAMVALQVLATQGAKFGWTSAISLALLAAAIVFGVIFFRTESGNPRAFVDFRLFRNLTYTGATLSRSFDSAADADVPAARYLQDPGDRCVHVFRIGLAFYATPSTDAALANLPDDQAGSGSGIYKMASSLGASFGVAISAAIFTALSADNSTVDWIAGVITFVGRQDNLAIRQAALFAFGANLVMVVAAIISIMLTVPSGRSREEHRA